ncbi:hypothetical protein OGAPHI_005816 [Ogataea philodendri]|uniref:Arylsulfotransferase n=1 Tax=Ogataea philodendri TaxID=1378263 RepID=A0A9P8P0R8_9ASCO|nr:uncharacterized protein OGAPHI_005816 [Ogataea philodendri]KAH3662564.1 hypothetical protein OGAPHI_005816 [Ogataea philodendri]
MLSALLLFLLPVYADWQYRSRSDLAPPQLNITIFDHDKASTDYLFVAPFSGFPDNTLHGPRQAAPYIFSAEGDLVWSGYSIFSIWNANFQAAKFNGQDILFSFEGDHNPAYGHGHGHHTFLNNRYELVKELRAGKHKLSDKHEFHIKDEKTGLLQVYQPVPRDLSEFGASEEQQWIVNAIFQELDLETGEVLFEWASLDHVSPHESVLPINPGYAGSGYNSSDAWDYFHINSVDKDENGDYLLSARDAASVYKIDGKTGEVIWKLGGIPGETSSSFENVGGFRFGFQHHARYLWTSEDGKKQIISFFDNSAHGTEDKHGHLVKINEVSSGKVVEVNTETWEAKLLKNYQAPYGLLAKSQGSAQVLESGNVLVNWGSEGAVTEYTADGEIVFHAFLESGELADKVENYRAFKYDWHGYPTEDVAVLSEITDDGETQIYVSWNGDTETKLWKFYAVKNGSKTYIGEAKRTGFETKYKVAETHEAVYAEALDKSGRILASSEPAIAIQQVLPFKAVAAQPETLQPNFLNYFSWRQQI